MLLLLRFYVFYVFSKYPKSRDFLRFSPCFVRFFELCSRLLVRRQKKHGFQTCCSEHVEQTVDDTWQIIDAGDQELQTQANSRVNQIKCLSNVSLMEQLSHRNCKQTCTDKIQDDKKWIQWIQSITVTKQHSNNKITVGETSWRPVMLNRWSVVWLSQEHHRTSRGSYHRVRRPSTQSTTTTTLTTTTTMTGPGRLLRRRTTRERCRALGSVVCVSETRPAAAYCRPSDSSASKTRKFTSVSQCTGWCEWTWT